MIFHTLKPLHDLFTVNNLEYIFPISFYWKIFFLIIIRCVPFPRDFLFSYCSQMGCVIRIMWSLFHFAIESFFFFSLFESLLSGSPTWFPSCGQLCLVSSFVREGIMIYVLPPPVTLNLLTYEHYHQKASLFLLFSGNHQMQRLGWTVNTHIY